MLIAKGKVSATEPWRILEVAIGQSPDVLALRISRELKRIHESHIEALVPMRRNVDGDPEWIIEHVYVRGANGSLPKLARVAGIEFIRKENADSQWIAELLKHEHEREPKELRLGAFVRVLTGPCARLCGHILSMKDKRVTVAIRLRTKRVLCHTFPENLQTVQCLPEHECFFYESALFS